MSGFWTCHECGAEMYGFENCQFCGAHKDGEAKTETNYERLFGSPERAARTICRQLKHFNICICDGCPVKPPNKECNCEYDALLEWMRDDAE